MTIFRWSFIIAADFLLGPLSGPPLVAQQTTTAKETIGQAMMFVPLLEVPDLSVPQQRLVFQRQGKDRCGANYAVKTRQESTGAAPGTFIGQSPPPQTRVHCSDIVSVTFVRIR